VNYLSVCSGIEAATAAWHDLGWKPLGFSEIEKFPSQVLSHHYPDVINYGDMTKYKEWNINGTVDLLVGGTPCQSFSVAGLRKGLEDPRGNLALTYVGILDHFRPKWFVWENVPGVLSSGGGRDFGSFLGAVAELGYGFAYRVLDAQYFGVPQRRRRVFVVGCLGSWEHPAQVLFEPESLSGNPKQSRTQRKGTPAFVESSFGQYREDTIAGTTKASGGVLGGGSETFLTVYENHPSDSRVKYMGDVCQTVTSTWGMGGGNVPFVQQIPYRKSRRAKSTEDHETWVRDEVSNTINTFDLGDVRTTEVIAVRTANTNANGHGIAHQVSHTLDGAQGQAVAFSFDSLSSNSMKSKNPISGCREVQLSKTLDTTNPCPSKNQGGIGVMHNMAVRRLTPVECERLQGFPDNYTDIQFGGKPTPDGPRYKALGNSMAVPVMRWIGQRINMLTSQD
jgi:DNA (cytosine-5)-methyltransferase 1